jgi:hypothetical protein
MSIFTFRKIMFTKKNPLFWIFAAFANLLPHMLCRLDKKRGRVHKKNGKKREKLWIFLRFSVKWSATERLLLVSITMVRNFCAVG